MLDRLGRRNNLFELEAIVTRQMCSDTPYADAMFYESIQEGYDSFGNTLPGLHYRLDSTRSNFVETLFNEPMKVENASQKQSFQTWRRACAREFWNFASHGHVGNQDLSRTTTVVDGVLHLSSSPTQPFPAISPPTEIGCLGEKWIIVRIFPCNEFVEKDGEPFLT